MMMVFGWKILRIIVGQIPLFIDNKTKFLHKKLSYRVNDLRFFKYSDASKYVSKIKRLAQKDGVEIHIATYQR